MFVQGITDDFDERFALMICSFYAPGQGFDVIGWTVQAQCIQNMTFTQNWKKNIFC